ncbi:nucleotidyltransferase family protein [Ectopseudomonas mendocina]|uniref:Nucleotidyltransferase family protein n=1 Tax=Ectopseudomonas mendocina TaxID=300 RepID=A0ABZ2RFU0_ECTME
MHQQLLAILAADPMRMAVLRQVKALGLPDCWVAAGCVRNAVWDQLHQLPISTPLADIDVIWFDPDQASAEVDARFEQALQQMDSRHNWSVKNQARMHLGNADQPYTSSTDAMCYWPETATAVAVRLGVDEQIEIAAPYGLGDLFNLIVRPTAKFAAEKQPIYTQRQRSKNWAAIWPQLRFAEG